MSTDYSRDLTSAPDPVPLSIRALLELFDDALAGVSFPDVDHAVLSELCETVETHAQAVEAARRALADTQKDLDKSLEMLKSRAQKGHAYARIFADGNPELLERLEAIQLNPRSGKSSRTGDKAAKGNGSKRGRKPKAKSEGPELPLNGAELEALPKAS